jgi:hypothetical protein
MLDINALIKTVPQLLDPSISIKLVEVAKKYNTPEVSPILLCILGSFADGIGRTYHSSPRVHQTRRSQFLPLFER